MNYLVLVLSDLMLLTGVTSKICVPMVMII